ncbi:Repeat domain-containing protein [Actinacidiphila alni]|uniref:Repeat domain-containing protein n=1 Tax=Actinacidiphila alni TaxID=380248 RepID=A0A1I2JKC3_9ACTN|nr:VCBS repeat-containing protein [Actinacidiphila alni]SFF55302.1 Repeat domain-containing protein [Actinacidiphila alni]
MSFTVRESVRRVALRTAGWSAAAALAALAVVIAPGAHAERSGSAPAADRATTATDGADVHAVAGSAPMLPLFGRTTDGHLRAYEPKGSGGGLQAYVDLGGGYSTATALFRLPVSGDGGAQDLYIRMNNALYYTAERGTETKLIGTGWDQFNLLMSPGNMGGAAQPDVIARDTAGALWLYQGKTDGTFLTRVQAGTGWSGMDVLAGYGDYTGDGKNDLLARTPAGTLYLYPGTGSVTANAILGTRVTVGTGWNAYKTLVSTGDNDGDGKPDLIASDSAGALWLFKGTGKASAPFAARVQIGTSGWAGFNAFF